MKTKRGKGRANAGKESSIDKLAGKKKITFFLSVFSGKSQAKKKNWARNWEKETKKKAANKYFEFFSHCLNSKSWRGEKKKKKKNNLKGLYFYIITPSSGYLGSRNDEERSNWRYAVRIAGFRESLDFRTHSAPAGQPAGMSARVSAIDIWFTVLSLGEKKPKVCCRGKKKKKAVN